MKKVLGIAIATLLLVSTLSIQSLADGGAPEPQCVPGQCTLTAAQLR
jgi:hypothetical protein